MKKEIQKYDKGGKLSLGENLNISKLNLGALEDLTSEIVLPRTFYQLVIFMLDGSNSMSSMTEDGRSKAVRIEESVKSVLTRLKNSKNKESFDLSFIVFSDDYKDVFNGVTRVIDIDERQCFNPIKLIQEPKDTKLADALKYANIVSNKYLEENSKRTGQVLLLIFSDGELDDYWDALKVVNEIKRNPQITIACQYLENYISEGSQWYSYDEATDEINYNEIWTTEDVKESEKRISEKFKEFASMDELFITTMNPNLVRDHMIKSITLVSKTNL
jgi:hypothetical protein